MTPLQSISPIPMYMTAAVLVGHGGPSSLQIRNDVVVPEVLGNEALIRVHACGVNNTDINTRLGWYSNSISQSTEELSDNRESVDVSGTWGGQKMSFPRIQGADIVGTVVKVADERNKVWLGKRVLVDPTFRNPLIKDEYSGWAYVGSERDGGFAQFTTADVGNLATIKVDYSDEELATIGCSYTTAENMLERARVGENDIVFVTGASGGVGGALVQLVKRRGSKVIALTSSSKAEYVTSLGADGVALRDGTDWEDVVYRAAGVRRVSVVADVVGAPVFKKVMRLLAKGGRYVTAGAIGGKVVQVDLSDLYLKDWSMIGCTVTKRDIFKKVIGYIENGEISPSLAGSFPLEQIHKVQSEFLKKKHCGSFVLIPPGVKSS